MSKRHGTVAPVPEVAYEVHESVEVSFCDRNGSEVRVTFPAGKGTPSTPEEHDALELILVPAGQATRIEKES